ncbi:MAG: DUF6249 domain-containing protein [bacterium]
MSGDLVPIIIVPVIFFSFVALVKIISDNAVRRKLIEKGLVDENVKHLYVNSLEQQVPASLKWGMVLVAIGAAILIGQMFPRSFSDEATVSGMFIMAGLALIAYYFVASNMVRRSRSRNAEKKYSS